MAPPSSTVLKWSLLLLLFACFCRSEALVVRMGWFEEATPSHGPFRRHLLESAFPNLTIEHTIIDSGIRLFPMLANDEIDIIDSGGPAYFRQFFRGADVVGVYISQFAGTSTCVVVRTSKIRGPQQMIGYRVATPYGTTGHYLLSYFLSLFNLERKVTVVFMSPDEIKTAWAAKTIDAASVWGGAFEYILLNGGHMVFSSELSASYGHPIGDAMVVRGAFAREHPHELKQILQMRSFFDSDYTKFPAQNWTFPPGSRWLDSVVDCEFGSAAIGNAQITTSVNVELRKTVFFNAEDQVIMMENDFQAAYVDMLQFQLDQKLIPDSITWSANASASTRNPFDTSFMRSLDRSWSPPDMVGWEPIPFTQQASQACAALTTLNADTGIFTDGHGVNSSYLQNQHCEWLISRSSDPSLPVRLSFSLFRLECGYDFLSIYDLDDPGWLIARFTGARVPRPVVHKHGVRVVFESDGGSLKPYNRVETQGFEAKYDGWMCSGHTECGSPRGTCVLGQCVCVDGYGGSQCELSTCQGTRLLTASQGVFTSGVAPYTNDQDCRWRVVSPSPSVAVRFDSISLEDSYDFLYIYSGTTVSSSPLISLTGSHSSLTLHLATPFTIRLLSDALITTNQTAFRATYWPEDPCATTPPCSGHGRPVTGGIQSQYANMSCVCVCEPGYFGAGCSLPWCDMARVPLTDTQGSIVTHATSLSSYQNQASCQWQIIALAELAPRKAREAAQAAGKDVLEGVTFYVSSLDLEPNSGDVVKLWGRARTTDTWTLVSTLTGSDSACQSVLDCSGDSRGQCVFGNNSVVGVCACLPGWTGGACDMPSSVLVPYAFAQVTFSSDINNRHHVYSGPNLQYEVAFYGMNALNTTRFSLPSYLAPLVTTLSCLAGGFIVCLFVFVLRFRHTNLIKASSWRFLTVFIAGGLLTAISGILFVIQPDTNNVVCQARLWVLTIAYVTLLTPLIAKTMRIHLIFKQRNLQTVKLPDATVFKIMLVMFVFPLLVLVFQLLYTDIKSVYMETLSGDAFSRTITPMCSQHAITLALLFGFGFIYMLIGILLCWSVADTPSEFNESSHITNIMTFIMLYCILIVPVQFLVENNPTAVAFLRSFGIIFGACICQAALFVPKIMVVFNGRADSSGKSSQGPSNNTMTTTTTTTVPPTGSSISINHANRYSVHHGTSSEATSLASHHGTPTGAVAGRKRSGVGATATVSPVPVLVAPAPNTPTASAAVVVFGSTSSVKGTV